MANEVEVRFVGWGPDEALVASARAWSRTLVEGTRRDMRVSVCFRRLPVTSTHTTSVDLRVHTGSEELGAVFKADDAHEALATSFVTVARNLHRASSKLNGSVPDEPT
ncbi:MAG: hypothetical protein AAF436_03770 [Myxococcota bacterium]